MSENILIIYYSHSGNTRRIAEIIREVTGAVLVRIEPVNPYPEPYSMVLEQARKEIQAGYMPALQPLALHLDSVETLFVGTPNWFSTIAPPVAAFLSEHDLSGKTIIPFCTHGSGGLAKIEKDMKERCPKSTFLESLAIPGNNAHGAQARVAAWLQEIGL